MPFGARGPCCSMAGVDLTVLEGIERDDGAGDPERDRHGHEQVADGEELRELAGVVSAASGLQPARSQAAGCGVAATGRRGRCGWRPRAVITPRTLGGIYRRIQARCGGTKAVVATARKIAERVYRLLKYGVEYVRQGIEAYEAAYRERLLKGLAYRAESLGYALVALPETPPSAAGTPATL